MSMANRNDPDVRQHETLPGLCPAPSHSLSLPSGARPVEQMMDAAIERIERGARERGAFERSVAERGAIERVAHEQQLANYDYDLVRGQPPSSNATRLRWKGLDVSDEFREYAERIARGEDLPPFEGRVLAEPNAAFPWGSLSRSETPVLSSAGSVNRPGRGGQLALWTSAAVVMALLGWSVALKFQAIEPPRALVDVAATAVAVPPVASSAAPSPDPSALASAAVPRASEEAVAPAAEAVTTVPAAIEPPPSSPIAAASPAVPVAPAAPAAAAAAEVPAQDQPSAAPSPAVAAGVAVSIAPALAEPLATPASAPSAVAAPTPAPAPAPKPTASPRQDTEIDFGIDDLPLPSASTSATKGQVSEAGNIGDLARVGQSGTGPARKEPGSESSAKGSLLVDKPSF
jgi:hypothetical protein